MQRDAGRMLESERDNENTNQHINWYDSTWQSQDRYAKPHYEFQTQAQAQIVPQNDGIAVPSQA